MVRLLSRHSRMMVIWYFISAQSNYIQAVMSVIAAQISLENLINIEQ